MLTIDDRLELWFSGKYTPKERYYEAQRRTAFGRPTSPQEAAMHSLLIIAFLAENCSHALSSVARDRFEWAARQGTPFDQKTAMSFIVQYGVFGTAPSWIVKWKNPRLDDIAFDCWCRRTIEVLACFEASEFPKPVEDWIDWFNAQLIAYRSGEPYETEYNGPTVKKEGPNPYIEQEIPI